MEIKHDLVALEIGCAVPRIPRLGGIIGFGRDIGPDPRAVSHRLTKVQFAIGMRNVIAAFNAKQTDLSRDFQQLKVDFDSCMRPDEVPCVEILVAIRIFDVGILTEGGRSERQRGDYTARKSH